MAQVYSRRLWSAANSSGTLSLVNPGPNLYIVRTVTVYYGGLAATDFGLNDENNAAMLYVALNAGATIYTSWGDIRLVWPAGATWTIVTTAGVDTTGHGYELTTP
jgi:hypothetical protein